MLRPEAVVFAAQFPTQLARFWADALGWPLHAGVPDGAVVAPSERLPWADGGMPALVFAPGAAAKQGKNRVHLDLASADRAQQRDTVVRLVDLGATRVDIGQGEVPWTVLADPEGNELCVLEPREEDRDGPRVAAAVVDVADPAAVAPSWEEATGWSVVTSQPDLVTLRPPGGPATRLELLRVAEVGGDRVRVGLVPDTPVVRIVVADVGGSDVCLLPPSALGP